MDDPALSKVDLRLLEHLEALVAEGHVSRAAERMGVGQPAMSAMLAKLRKLTGDPLLVRSSTGMVPTERAIELAAQVSAGVGLIRAALSAPAQFEAATAVRQFRIMGVDSLALLLLPGLLAYVEDKAPNIKISFVPADGRMALELLETDQCDLVIGYLPAPAKGLHASTLFEQKLYVIAGENHPDIRGAVSLEQYVAWPHAILGAGATPVSATETAVDRALRTHKLARTIGTRVHSSLLIPMVVSGTTMLGTIAERTARALLPVAPVQLLEPPLQLPSPKILMAWHQRTHKDEAQRWMRSAVRRQAARL